MTHIDPWRVVTTLTDETSLRNGNSIFAVSNGYLTLKGNLAEHRGGDHPTTLAAGVFDRADWIAFIRPTGQERRFHDPKYFDNAGWSPSIANLPDPIHLRVFMGSRELTFRAGTVHDFCQTYEMRRGLARYEYTHVSPEGRTTRVVMERFCSMNDPHRAHLRYTLTPLDHQDRIQVISGINGAVRSNLHNEKQIQVLSSRPLPDGACHLRGRTLHSEISLETAVRTRITAGTVKCAEPRIEESAVSWVFEVEGRTGKPLVVEKVMVVATGEDEVHGVACDPVTELENASTPDFETALAEQQAFWCEAWDRLDVQIEGDDEAQRDLRFNLMHLMSAAPRHTDRLSIPCKLLTGEYYQGTVFYDTDLYIEPVFVFTFPEIARSMLTYRWHGLEPGRRIAKRLGYKGAKFAWQAGPRGEEELGPWWRYTVLNIHINADVCHSLMLYLHATGDFDFVAEKGIDILVESARFYCSRAERGPEAGTCSLVEVAGPDEGHCESTDNFYTNSMAARCLRNAWAMLDRMQRERPHQYDAARERLHIDPSEPEAWLSVAEGLRILHHSRTRIYEQCEGFFSLKDAPDDLLQDRPFWWVIVHPYRAIYQPDVCMALALNRRDFDPDVLAANHEYYMPITLNFSSMSFCINAIMAVESDDMAYAYDQFRTSAALDLDPARTGRNDTHEGIHGTNAGGAWMAAVLGFGGLAVTGDGVSIHPRLPEKWRSLRYRFRFRGEVITCHVTHDRVHLEANGETGQELPLTVNGTAVLLRSGAAVEVV